MWQHSRCGLNRATAIEVLRARQPGGRCVKAQGMVATGTPRCGMKRLQQTSIYVMSNGTSCSRTHDNNIRETVFLYPRCFTKRANSTALVCASGFLSSALSLSFITTSIVHRPCYYHLTALIARATRPPFFFFVDCSFLCFLTRSLTLWALQPLDGFLPCFENVPLKIRALGPFCRNL